MRNKIHHSEEEESDGNNWIGGTKDFKSTKGEKLKEKFESPSSSIQIGSASTHTSPKFQYNTKLIKKKTTVEKYIEKNEFKSFLQNAKRQVLSERNEEFETTRKSKSPFRIVDKLLDDAQRRLQIKEKNEVKGQGNAFASTFSGWNKTLRNNRHKHNLGSTHSQSAVRSRKDSQVGFINNV